jgi:hypothetical protein
MREIKVKVPTTLSPTSTAHSAVKNLLHQLKKEGLIEFRWGSGGTLTDWKDEDLAGLKSPHLLVLNISRAEK